MENKTALTPIEELRIEIASFIPDLQYVLSSPKKYHPADVEKARYEMDLYKNLLNKVVNIETDINENYIDKEQRKELRLKDFDAGYNEGYDDGSHGQKHRYKTNYENK